MQSAFGYRLRNKLYSNMKSHIWIMNSYNFNYMTIEFSFFKLLKRSVELFIVIYESPYCQNLEGRDFFVITESNRMEFSPRCNWLVKVYHLKPHLG